MAGPIVETVYGKVQGITEDGLHIFKGIHYGFGEDKRTRLPAQCRSCPWLNLCNGGCPKDRCVTTLDGEPGLNYLCSGLRRFFAHAEKPLRQVLELRKRGVRSETIMVQLRTTELARWKGIGRNDPCPCGSGRKAKDCCWHRHP